MNRKTNAGTYMIQPTTKIDEKIRKIFMEATMPIKGTFYKPLIFVGTQTVNGRNYKFIVLGRDTVPQGNRSIAVMEVYVPLDNPPEVTAITNLVTEEGKEGGWSLVCAVDKLPQKLASGFFEAFSGISGASYTPLLYTGCQVVQGINHMVYCLQTSTNTTIQYKLVSVVLHESLDGKISVSSISEIY